MIRKSHTKIAISFVSGLLILVILAIIARVDVDRVLSVLSATKPLGVAAIVSLFFAYILVGSVKWRLVQNAMGNLTISLRQASALTAVGVAGGQVLPVPVAVAVARLVGVHGGTDIKPSHNLVGTLIEQFFDLAIALLLGSASLVVLYLGQSGLWLYLVVGVLSASAAVTELAYGYYAPILRALAEKSFLPQKLRALAASVAANMPAQRLVRQLSLLSILRFAILCVAAAATSWTMGLAIPALHLAIAMPLVILASVIALTPGALGFNELAYAGSLVILGTSFDAAAEWALFNRILTMLASLLIGLAGAVVLVLDVYRRSGREAGMGKAAGVAEAEESCLACRARTDAP
jgi:uncharacterized membrane protein YbhN (UPF0104 family)